MCLVSVAAVDSVLKRMTIIGVILSFRSLAQEALRDVRGSCWLAAGRERTYMHIWACFHLCAPRCYRATFPSWSVLWRTLRTTSLERPTWRWENTHSLTHPQWSSHHLRCLFLRCRWPWTCTNCPQRLDFPVRLTLLWWLLCPPRRVVSVIHTLKDVRWSICCMSL